MATFTVENQGIDPMAKITFKKACIRVVSYNEEDDIRLTDMARSQL